MQAQYWVALAKRRVLRILERRRFASIRQLEKKIAEAGPPAVRAEPVKISKAVTSLIAKGEIIAEPQSPLSRCFDKYFRADSNPAGRAAIVSRSDNVCPTRSAKVKRFGRYDNSDMRFALCKPPMALC